MPDGILLLTAFIATLTGLCWLALSMTTHWKQIRKGPPSARTLYIMRILGGAALAISLVLCLNVDHASMAMLVWIMLLAVAAASITFTLTLRPYWLGFMLLPFDR